MLWDRLAATDVTSSVTDDGVARVLAGFEGIQFVLKNHLGLS